MPLFSVGGVRKGSAGRTRRSGCKSISVSFSSTTSNEGPTSLAATDDSQPSHHSKLPSMEKSSKPIDGCTTDSISTNRWKRVNEKDGSSHSRPSLSDDEDDRDSDEEDRDSDEESSVGSEYEGLARLERKLDLRMARLRRLSAGRRPSYVRLMETHQAAVREIAIAEYKRSVRDKEEPSKSVHGTAADEKAGRTQAAPSMDEEPDDRFRHPPLYLRIWWWLLFEAHHTIPASCTLLVVCMGHLTFYSFVDILLRTCYQTLFSGIMAYSTFVVLHIFAGFGLLRANGYLFDLLKGRSLRMVNFDMRNRLKLRHADARLLEVLKESLLGSATNMLGFYLIYNGLSFVYNQRVHPAFFKPLDELYTSIRDEAAKQVPEGADLKFYSRLDFAELEAAPDGTGMEQETCSILKAYVAPRFEWWFSYCCMDPFQEFRIHDVTFHGLWFLATAWVAALMGLNVLKFCDEGA
jgi:hypothetical protein